MEVAEHGRELDIVAPYASPILQLCYSMGRWRMFSPLPAEMRRLSWPEHRRFRADDPSWRGTAIIQINLHRDYNKTCKEMAGAQAGLANLNQGDLSRFKSNDFFSKKIT